MRFLSLFLIPSLAIAFFNEIPDELAFDYKIPKEDKVKTKFSSIKKRPKAKRNLKLERQLEQLNKSLEQKEKRLMKLLEKENSKIITYKSNAIVPALKTYEATLLKTVVSSNRSPDFLLLKFGNENELLEGAKIRCASFNVEKRVRGICKMMVLNDITYKVNLTVLDSDGGEGLLADYHYDGLEKEFLTTSLATAMSSFINSSKERSTTAFGEFVKNNPRNNALSGLTDIYSNSRDLVKKSGEGKIRINVIKPGKKALIIFNEEFNFKKERK
ncbi:MAG: hypothetical protein ACPGJV_12950 [Bacteriovoracaceae bacterium]